MKLGYARISAGEDSLALQIEALRGAGVTRDQIYIDEGVSGSAVIKPAYSELLRAARAGDELVTWRLDRLSRSLSALVHQLQQLGRRGLVLRSLSEPIDTAESSQDFFHLAGAFASFERDVADERAAILQSTDRRASSKQGRPPLITPERWQEAMALMAPPHNMSITAVASRLNVSRQAVHKRLRAET
jgi:DNA invertase Pin-like site-specific DNA recombinase